MRQETARGIARGFARAIAGIGAAAIVWGAGAWPAAAQNVADFYKGKTVRIIVGFSPGGGYDQYGRLVARFIGKYIPGNPTVVVQNMPGAASLKSVQFLNSGAPADGTVITTFNPGLLSASRMTPDKVPVNFLDYAWIGSVSEDYRVCFTWNGTGVKTWKDFLARPKVTFGNTGVGTSAYVDNRMLSELFGAKLQMVQGYPGSADKRLAVERGELDGDCGSWTSMPEEWLRDKKITTLMRFSKTLAPGMPKDLPYAGDLLSDPKKKQVFSFLTSSALIGRPFMVPKAVPANRVAALRTAFNKLMKDAEFLADAQRQSLTVTPMSGPDVAAAIKELYDAPTDILEQAKAVAGG